jgi:hypothetical protein
VLFGSSGTVLAINVLTLGLLAYGGISGDLALTAIAVYVQALAGANSYTAFDDANAYLSFAAVAVPKILELDAQLDAGDGPKPALTASPVLPPKACGSAIPAPNATRSAASTGWT